MAKAYRILDHRALTSRDGSMNEGVVKDIRASEDAGQTVIVRNKEQNSHRLGVDILENIDDAGWPLGEW